MEQKGKKRITVIALIVLLLLSVGGTLAYLTSSKTQQTTFTAGKVSISLDEAVLKQDGSGKIYVDGDKRTSARQSYHLYPAMSVTKDPTIRVSSDSECAYVAAAITVKGNVYSLLGNGNSEHIDFTRLLSGGVLDETLTKNENWNGLSVLENDNFVLYQKADKKNNTWTLYIFMKHIREPESTIVLFDTLSISSSYDNDEMALIDNMTIEVAAYATQTYGFNSCYHAMTSAFDSAFSFGSN